MADNSVNPILQNCKMDKTKLLNGIYEIVKPIPDSNKKVRKKVT